ncbi:hypothetical protein [Nonomuraea sp. NPDC048901]|uniref:hypothetical protein n=1 Tax=Nonomuraea sp. NPDC048901 TaxID=3155627 RepID=UPI0033D62FD2
MHQHLDIGRGEVDWDTFFATLNRLGFAGGDDNTMTPVTRRLWRPSYAMLVVTSAWATCGPYRMTQSSVSRSNPTRTVAAAPPVISGNVTTAPTVRAACRGRSARSGRPACA